MRRSCNTPGSASPSCSCFNALAWWNCRRAMACRVEAACPKLGGSGQSCMAMARSTGGTSTYPWAAPPSRVVRTEEALGLFRAEKGAFQDLVTSSCTSGKKGTGGGCRRSACAPRNQSSSLERSGEGTETFSKTRTNACKLLKQCCTSLQCQGSKSKV